MFRIITDLFQGRLDFVHVHRSWSGSRVFLGHVRMVHILEDIVHILEDMINDRVVSVHGQLEIIHSVLVSVLPQQLLVLHGESVQVLFSLVDGGDGVFSVISKCVDSFLEMESLLQHLLIGHGVLERVAGSEKCFCCRIISKVECIKM